MALVCAIESELYDVGVNKWIWVKIVQSGQERLTKRIATNNASASNDSVNLSLSSVVPY